MLAFSVREALRQAAAAFGPSGTGVELASPATPEAVFWAIQQARRGGAAGNGHAAGGAADGSAVNGALDGSTVNGGVRAVAEALHGA
ncbi:hypothetical protein ACFQXA_19435 [Nocardiopsis composta]